MTIHTIGAKPIPQLNTGDVVFFKKCTKTLDRRAQEIGFKGGSGFAVMLGAVPAFAQMPTEAMLMMLMGRAGYIAFDDVFNFLGEDLAKECLKKFEDKYYPKLQNTPDGPKMVLPDYKKPSRVNVETQKAKTAQIAAPAEMVSEPTNE